LEREARMIGRFPRLTECEAPDCESRCEGPLCENCRRGIPPRKQRKNPVGGRTPRKTSSPEDPTGARASSR
jgi:hypothetical protein